MISSTATKYAIRAVCHLAELPEGHRAQAKEISEALDIPPAYLSKILQNLAKKRILSSTKGPGGGFRLLALPAETSLYTLIQAVEGDAGEDQCILGLDICGDAAPCPMHELWKGFRATFRQRMQSITVLDVVRAAERKKQIRP